MAIDPAWIALVGTICGGVGLKLAEHWLGRNKVKADDATQIRNELRLEITTQKEEIRQLELDGVKWRDEYYKLYEKYIADRTAAAIELDRLKSQILALQAAPTVVSLERQTPQELPPAP